MHTKIYSEALYGIEGIPIVIEVNISEGLPKFDVVGLPDQAVNEAKERVIAAINNSDRFFPPKRITINLAPADLKKTGSMYEACTIYHLLWEYYHQVLKYFFLILWKKLLYLGNWH